MVGKFVLGVVIMAGTFGFAGTTHAKPMKAICTVSASVHGEKKFATLKCSKDSRPGDYVIRSTAWETKDRAEYKKLARFAGRKFTCDLILSGTTRDSGMETTHYDLEHCK